MRYRLRPLLFLGCLLAATPTAAIAQTAGGWITDISPDPFYPEDVITTEYHGIWSPYHSICEEIYWDYYACYAAQVDVYGYSSWGGVAGSSHFPPYGDENSLWEFYDEEGSMLGEPITYDGDMVAWYYDTYSYGYFAVGGTFQARTVEPAPILPINETSETLAWNGNVLPFKQTLHGGSFGGRKVREENGAGSNDTCDVPDDDFDAYESLVITGDWDVTGDNTWQADNLSWHADDIRYYRGAGRAPCQTNIVQRMLMNKTVGSTEYLHYKTSTLQLGIDTVTIWARRLNAFGQRIWTQ